MRNRNGRECGDWRDRPVRIVHTGITGYLREQERFEQGLCFPRLGLLAHIIILVLAVVSVPVLPLLIVWLGR